MSASLFGRRLPTTCWATLAATSRMVSVSSTRTSWVTKSSSNLALMGTGCGSGMRTSFCSRGCYRLAVLFCPLVLVGVVTHHLRGKAHPGQDAAHVGRLDIPSKQVFNDRLLVQRILVLPPDLATWPRAEVIRVAVVRERIAVHGVLRVIGGSGRANGKVAQIAQPGQRFGQGPTHVACVDVLNEGIPDGAPLLLPVRVLLLQPSALGLRHASLWFPPHGWTPEPDAQVQRVVPGLQTSEKLLPVPGLLETVVLNQAQELGDDPFLHELLVGLLAMLERRVVVHAGPGEDGEQPGREPERLVDYPLSALGVVLHEDLEGWSALLRVE